MLSSFLRVALASLAAAVIVLRAAPTGTPQNPGQGQGSQADFDIRDNRPDVSERASEDTATPPRQTRGVSRKRLNRESGSRRLLDRPGLAAARGSANASIRALLAANARRLGLERADLDGLTAVRDYTSRATGVRHVLFRQAADGIPVFDSTVGVHLLRDGSIARITSNAAPVEGRDPIPAITSGRARAEAAAQTGAAAGAAGPASLAWLPVDGRLRLAWHVVVTGPQEPDEFDVLIDARSGELLLRRNRVRYANGFARVIQGPGTASLDPRRPDPMPFGADGTAACPPPVNYAVRSLNTQFRDPGTVLAATGFLEGNNTTVMRGSGAESAQGTFDGSTWLFDFPFNSAGSAEAFLFFAMNYAHDFYYDLGFDEASGNFQVDNFGRGGVAGDPIRARARAAGRNNANYVHRPDGTVATINMFLWDGVGCWGEDVDGDGTPDLDGDYDLDIVLHEYHHGVSLRLNTAFSGNEAGAIGEGGGDFFAYSVNDNTLLAEYSRPGGLRQVNDKGYGDWTCRQGLFCEVHANGEIWANVLWDVRERFRGDLVRGNEAAAINESHQLYIDGLKLSPPRPTMLDMRDAMIEADAIRNAGSPSQNFCRLWESFARRGMGLSATDTADNGSNRVGPAYDVPPGCQAPPLPLLVTVTAAAPNAFEASGVPGAFAIRRSVVSSQALQVNYTMSGLAVSGSDYVALSGSATIPANAADVTVTLVPIDDAAVENNEAVTLTVASGAGYAIGSPTFATVTIISDDVLPDLSVTGLSAPGPAGPGTTIQVTVTTRNQGTGTAGPSQTSFYLSTNIVLDASDPHLGSRSVGELAPGATNTGATPLVLPDPLPSGSYFLFAKADGPGSIAEINESNNITQTTVAVGPDLAVTAFTAPAQATPGAAVFVTETTANLGGATPPATATQFFLSANLTFEPSDTPLEARSVGALAPGTSSSASTVVTIPAGTAAGTYYLFAKADAGGVVVEPNEGNNLRTASIRVGADLTLTALAAPLRAASGATISVSDTTRNSGSASAGTSTTRFYLSTNLTLDGTDIKLEPARQVPVLAPNESSAATTTITLPPVANGSWFLLANADDANAVVEAFEQNNVRFTGIQIGPDLTILSLSVPSTGVSGATITITDTTRNVGAAEAGPSVVRYYLSTNSAFDAGDIPLNAVRAVPALAPNVSYAGSATVPLPSGMSGSFYVIVVADGGGAVEESSETNNVSARLIQISNP
jgi:subtilase family serine protease